MNLYIVRHAIALDREEWEETDDSRRPLTDLGRKKMRGIARGLAVLRIKPDMVLSSPFTRARQTAEILVDGLELKPSILSFSEALVPTSHPSQLVKEIAEKYDVADLAVVGHEPHLSSFLSYLLTGKTVMSTNFKKGGVSLLTVEIGSRAPNATLEWLLTPKQLLALGKSVS